MLDLAQHLAIALLLAAVAAVICAARRPGPAVRHALWLVVLFKLAMPPVVVVRTPWAWSALPTSSPDPQRSLNLSPATIPAVDRLPTAPLSNDDALSQQIAAGVTAASPTPWPDRTMGADSAAAIAVAIWSAGALLYLALQTVRIVRLRRWLRSARPADARLVARVNALAQRAQLPVVPIQVVPALSSPLIWSIRRPMLLWPADLPGDLSDACLDGLIIHELAHVRRRDHWVSWIELVAGTIWWWNPLFWYVRSQVREHAELACDACVVASLPGGRRAYAEALVAVCDVASRRGAPVPAIGVSTGSRRVLERRLVMIMRGRTSARLSRVAFAATTVLVAAAVPVWAQRAPTPAPRPIAAPAVEIALEPATPAPLPIPRRAPSSAVSVPVEPVRQLPSEAQRVISRFEDEQTQTRREAEARLAQQRSDVVRQLDGLRESYMKAGRLDDAEAIRDRIRGIQSESRSGVSIATRSPLAPRASVDGLSGWATTTTSQSIVRRDDLTRFRGQVGDAVAMTVTGRTDGSVWGSGIYTDDSSLGTAAVHAGVLREGETRTVTVTMLPGQDHYEASRQNGIRTAEYGEWGGSYRIEGVSSAAPVTSSPTATTTRPVLAPSPKDESDPQPNLSSFRDRVWESFTITVVGSVNGSVWGTEIYTDDSSIATAAVHAGLLKPGERGTVKVTLLPGQRSYSGADRHGVSSQEYGAWDGSFRLERVK